jgi:hypothetical protein
VTDVVVGEMSVVREVVDWSTCRRDMIFPGSYVAIVLRSGVVVERLGNDVRKLRGFQGFTGEVFTVDLEMPREF